MTRFLVVILAALIAMSGCAQTNTPSETGAVVENQPHLPPPGFPPGPVSAPGDRICSGMVESGTLATCEANEFCFIPAGQFCGAADYPGVCRAKPDMCTQQYDPVCGCDGKTYSNECMAHSAGTSVADPGACEV